MSKGGELKITIRPQADFPLMDAYKEKFEITDRTIFALGLDIYTNYPLTPDLLVHELCHLKQQERIGVKKWAYDFLENPQKRLEFELEAYRAQILSVKDRNQRDQIRRQSAIDLSSSLYGNIITRDQAFTLLKV